MKTGFYNLKHLDIKQLRSLIKEAIKLSYSIHIDHILEGSWARERRNLPDLTIGNIHMKITTNTHNVFIDRSIQYPRDQFEIGFTYKDNNDIFLFCYLHKDNANVLINKYKLEMQ